MRIKILNKVWTLAREVLDRRKEGWAKCDSPDTIGKRIVIDSRAKGRDELETYIHEMLHAADWWKDEYWIENVAHDIARVLTRLGYRKCEDGRCERKQGVNGNGKKTRGTSKRKRKSGSLKS